MSRKARDKIARQEKTVERRDRMLDHDFTADRATFEEVFDKATIMIIYSLLNSGVIDEIHGVVSSGKEARVYWGKTKEGKELAVKIYLTASAEFKKGMLKYIEGDYRFKTVKKDTRGLISAWAQKEYRNLEQAARAGVRVPKPVAVRSNVLVMEFIGEGGVSAPSLKEQSPSDPEEVYGLLLTYLKLLYQKAELVHGDLSEYNVMLWKGETVVFDMAQAVPPSHPLAEVLLRRDLVNVNRFFSRLGVKVVPVDEIFKRVVG